MTRGTLKVWSPLSLRFNQKQTKRMGLVLKIGVAGLGRGLTVVFWMHRQRGRAAERGDERGVG